jgi:hypothetical protein
MNIFYLHSEPSKCAEYHCDKHASKMTVESAQMLASAYYAVMGFRSKKEAVADWGRVMETFQGFPRKHSDGTENPYGIGYFHHPCTKWARESLDNWYWLLELGDSLADSFQERYQKEHGCKRILQWMRDNPPKLTSNGFTEPPRCMPDYLKEDATLDTVQAYREFYIREKKFAVWNKSVTTPTWFNQ